MQQLGNLFVPSGSDNFNKTFLVLHIDRFITYLVTDVLFGVVWLRFRQTGDVYNFYSQQEHAQFSIFQSRNRILTNVNTFDSSIKLSDDMLEDFSDAHLFKQRETEKNNSIQFRR